MKYLKLFLPAGILLVLAGVLFYNNTGKMYPSCMPVFIGLVFLLFYFELFQADNLADWIHRLRKRYF